MKRRDKSHEGVFKRSSPETISLIFTAYFAEQNVVLVAVTAVNFFEICILKMVYV